MGDDPELAFARRFYALANLAAGNPELGFVRAHYAPRLAACVPAGAGQASSVTLLALRNQYSC